MKITKSTAAVIALLSCAGFTFGQTTGGTGGTTGGTDTGTGTGTGATGTGTTGTDTGTGTGTGTTGTGTSTTGTDTGMGTGTGTGSTGMDNGTGTGGGSGMGGNGSGALDNNGNGSNSQQSMVLNTSVRTTLAAGRRVIVGLVLGGSSNQTVLIRAVGPGLSAFGLTGGLTQPSISLFRGGQLIATNTGGWGAWDVNANVSSGGNGTGTSAGSGTGTGTGTDTGSGTDTGTTGTDNGSGTGTGSGTGSTGNSSFGNGSMPYNGTGVALTQTFTQAGAFPLTSGGADAAMAVGLQPGVYSIIVTGGSATDAGDVLVETYYLQDNGQGNNM